MPSWRSSSCWDQRSFAKTNCLPRTSAVIGRSAGIWPFCDLHGSSEIRQSGEPSNDHFLVLPLMTKVKGQQCHAIVRQLPCHFILRLNCGYDGIDTLDMCRPFIGLTSKMYSLLLFGLLLVAAALVGLVTAILNKGMQGTTRHKDAATHNHGTKDQDASKNHHGIQHLVVLTTFIVSATTGSSIAQFDTGTPLIVHLVGEIFAFRPHGITTRGLGKDTIIVVVKGCLGHSKASKGGILGFLRMGWHVGVCRRCCCCRRFRGKARNQHAEQQPCKRI